MLLEAGRVDEARVCTEQAMAVWRVAYGEHSHLGRGSTLLTSIALQDGDLERAREHASAASSIYERTLGPDHSLRADADINLGAIAFWQGDYAASRAAYERAVASLRRTKEPNYPDLGTALSNLGETLVALGQHTEALEALGEAERIMQAAPEPSADDLSRVLKGRGQATLGLGDAARAVSLLEVEGHRCATTLCRARRARGVPSQRDRRLAPHAFQLTYSPVYNAQDQQTGSKGIFSTPGTEGTEYGWKWTICITSPSGIVPADPKLVIKHIRK